MIWVNVLVYIVKHFEWYKSTSSYNKVWSCHPHTELVSIGNHVPMNKTNNFTKITKKIWHIVCKWTHIMNRVSTSFCHMALTYRPTRSWSPWRPCVLWRFQCPRAHCRPRDCHPAHPDPYPGSCLQQVDNIMLLDVYAISAAFCCFFK